MAENVATTATWNPAITFLVTTAFRDLGIVDDDEDPTGDQYNDAAYRLNGIFKFLAASGIHVWTEDEAILFLQLGVPQYLFAGTGTPVAGSGGYSMLAKACDADQWVSFELLSSYPTGTRTVELDVPAALLTGPALGSEDGGIIGLEGGGDIGLEYSYGIAVGDNFGVTLDSGAIFWTTVASLASQTVTLTDALPGSASQGNATFDYAPSYQVQRPLKVPRARLFTYASQTLIPMTQLARQGYMDLPQPYTPGVPTQFFYSPQRGIGRFYVWPNVQTTAWGVRFTHYRELADFLEPNNTADFPQEWILPLRQLLARDLITGYSVPPNKAQIAISNAQQAMETVIEWDRESEDVQFGMDWQLT